MITTTTQGPALPVGGGDQPLDKHIPITLTFQGGPLIVIGTQASTGEKKIEQPKDGAPAPTLLPHTTPSPSPHTTLVPSPHVSPISCPHRSPIASMSASLLNPIHSPI